MKPTQGEFEDLRRRLKQLCGIALSEQKNYLISTRLEPLLKPYGLQSYSDMIRSLEGNQRLRDDVIEAITTKETSFNRDGHPFDELRRSILPKLVQTLEERKQKGGIPFSRCRIWSVPSSTGQEPYSIGMAIHDFLAQKTGTQLTPASFWILATDLSERALQVAREGNYTDFDLERGVSSDHKQRYFVKLDTKWQVAPSIRSLVEFRRLNVLENFSDLTGFDLIFCRNLLIYFDEPTRIAVCEKLARSLNPDGMLLLGASEHLPSKMEGLFDQRQYGKTTLYVKR